MIVNVLNLVHIYHVITVELEILYHNRPISYVIEGISFYKNT